MKPRRESIGGSLAALVAISGLVVVFAQPTLASVVSQRKSRPVTALRVSIAGLRGTVRPAVIVTGPHHFRHEIRTDVTLKGIHPGRYFLTILPVKSMSGVFHPLMSRKRVTVRLGKTTSALVNYANFVPNSTLSVAKGATMSLTGPVTGQRVLTISASKSPVATVGDVLASAATTGVPDGYLVKVTRVVSDSNGSEVLDVSPTTLMQALPQGEFAVQRTFGSNALNASLRSPLAHAAAWARPGLKSHFSNQYFDCTASAKFVVVPSASVATTISLDVAWDALSGVSSASFQASITETLGITAHGDANATCKTSGRGIALFAHELSLGSFTAFAGTVPIEINPRLQIYLSGNASITGVADASLTQSTTASAGLNWTKKDGFLPSSSFVPSFTDSFSPRSSASADVHLVPTVTVLIDGLAGPSVDIGAGLSFTADTTKTTTPWWELDGCRDAGLGFRIAILGWSKDYSNSSLIHKCVPLLTATSGFGAGASSSSAFSGGSVSGGSVSGGSGGTPGKIFLSAIGLAGDGDGFCAILMDTSVSCWGYNSYGQLGDNGSELQSSSPVKVFGLSGVSALASDVAGLGYCALLDDGEIRCWGSNGRGELGDGGSELESRVPVSVLGIHSAEAISSDGDGYCAVLTNGTVKCWGPNDWGQLGDGGMEPQSNVPVGVQGILNAASLFSDHYFGYCALLLTGSTECWGANNSGQLGDGGSETKSNVPVAVSGLGNVSKLAGVPGGYCAVIGDGTVKCWGYNGNGQLGDGGAETQSNVPVMVHGLSDAVDISSQNNYGYCTVTSGAEVWCWGDNSVGQLGDGGLENRSYVPVKVQGVSEAHALASDGDYGFCSTLISGGVRCWGSNRVGRLGDGGTESLAITAVSVSSLTAVVTKLVGSPMAGFDFAYFGYCALASTGSVWCWGDGQLGQLGDGGTEATSNTPVQVAG